MQEYMGCVFTCTRVELGQLKKWLFALWKWGFFAVEVQNVKK